MSDDIDDLVKESQKLVEACSKLLAGQGPMVQGAALADLVAMWLSGFQGDDATTMRKKMLDNLLIAVEGLTEVNSAMLLERKMNETIKLNDKDDNELRQLEDD